MPSHSPDDLVALAREAQEALIAKRLGYELEPQPAAARENRPTVDPDAVAREAQAALMAKKLRETAADPNPTTPDAVARQAQAAMLLKQQREARGNHTSATAGGPAAGTGTAPTGAAWQQGQSAAPKPPSR
ncbi:hypothetical protein [Streptomyces axinellae]|jgi:hypothetical protein|uniref:Uncharacterized protein n=1 Tax=Streptomyces axinellae TaxID=552788 RepID=A0ABP6D6A3_9ACTN